MPLSTSGCNSAPIPPQEEIVHSQTACYEYVCAGAPGVGGSINILQQCSLFWDLHVHMRLYAATL